MSSTSLHCHKPGSPHCHNLSTGFFAIGLPPHPQSSYSPNCSQHYLSISCASFSSVWVHGTKSRIHGIWELFQWFFSATPPRFPSFPGPNEWMLHSPVHSPTSPTHLSCSAIYHIAFFAFKIVFSLSLSLLVCALSLIFSNWHIVGIKSTSDK